ncbi:MAG: J domain-containing protein [Proteobacteria bacterium]|nr:J domain-containing protein [Pseudomonadota bacterium]MBI3499415.1 J domain-containing protein [Pseudomonadota bacterium]
MPAPKSKTYPESKTYTVACPSRFRDRVNALARRRGVSVADLARAVLLTLPEEALAGLPDPGEPGQGDREEVRLKSGPGEGRRLRRKPRLQLRLEPGHGTGELRRALALALDLAEGRFRIRLEAGETPSDGIDPAEEIRRLKGMVGTLAFQPLARGIANREEALHVLGFPPGARPDAKLMKARFRALAQILHPDSATGDHLRMSQLNAAIRMLTRA